MYQITERHNAIKTVQKFLGQNQTGVYGENTRNKITEHQRKNNIEPSGIVDYETFNSIKAEYLAKGTEGMMLSSFPYKIGDTGTDIAIINAILSSVIDEYTFEGIFPSADYYSERTADTVARLREVFMLKPSREIDEEFISRLLIEKNAINLSKNNR